MEREKLVRLVTEAQSGDSEAFSELYSAFYNMVYTIALQNAKNRDIAADITHESFEEVLRTICNLQQPAAFVDWMRKITYHQCNRYFKKKKEILLDETDFDISIFDQIEEVRTEFIPDESLDLEDFRNTFQQIMNTLPEEQRSAVLMYYFEQMSVKQVADIQNVSDGTVKSRLNYARKNLRIAIEQYEKKHNVRLHSVGLSTILYWMYASYQASMPYNKAVEIAKDLSAVSGVNITISESTVAAASAGIGSGAAAVTTGTGVAAATSTVAGTATAIYSAITTKVVAAALAVAIIGGGAAAVISSTTKDDDRSSGEIIDVLETQKFSDSINLLDYLSVSFSGDNERGLTNVNFDYGAFEEILENQIGPNTNDEAELWRDILTIEEGLDLSIDKKSGLINGDIVTVTVSFDESIAENYNLDISGGSMTYQVSGLLELPEFTISKDDLPALISGSEATYWLSTVTIVPEKMSNIELLGYEVDTLLKTATVEYIFDLDCTLAILAVTGYAEYKCEGENWTLKNIYNQTELKKWTLTGTYTGTEWGIAGPGISCAAHYEIVETSDSNYVANITWSANNESPDMKTVSVTVPLISYFENTRFIITDTSAIYEVLGTEPYFSRALKFDFANGTLFNPGEVELTKEYSSENVSSPILPTTGSVDDYISIRRDEHIQFATSGDYFSNTYNFHCTIPEILINSNDADLCNQAIIDFYDRLLDEALEAQKSYNDIYYLNGISYNAWLYDRMAVLIISLKSQVASDATHTVYVFDIDTGMLLNSAEVAERLGIADQYEAQIKSTLEARFVSAWDQSYRGTICSNEFYDQQLQLTMSKDNIERTVLYPDEQGNIMAHCRIYNLAGTEYCEYLVRLKIS